MKLILFRSIFSLMSIFLFSLCSNSKTDIIELTNIPVNTSISIPIEIPASLIKQKSDNLIAISINDPEIKFVLQRGESIVDSKSAYSAILPKMAKNGEYEISSYKDTTIFFLKESEKGRLTVKEKENPILAYNFGMQLENGVPERYLRSTYVHPVYDLKGNILTDDFPDDHYHHRGLSWMWPKIFVDSVRYDLWHIYGPNAEYSGIHQVFEKWLVRETGPIYTNIGAKNIWQLDDGQTVMDEWVYLKIYKTIENARVIDVRIVFKARKHVGIEGQDKKGYGGLNFRFAPREETIITSMNGVEEDSDLKSLPWADQSAKFAGNDYFSGVSIFQKEENKDFPAGWCLRHYGFLGVAWPGVERFVLNSGESITLNFRVLIHDGNVEEGNVEEHYKVFKNPPVEISTYLEN